MLGWETDWQTKQLKEQLKKASQSQSHKKEIDISELKANSDSEDECLENILKATKNQEGGWVTNSQQLIVPLPVRRKAMGKEHNEFPRQIESLTSSLRNSVLKCGNN